MNIGFYYSTALLIEIISCSIELRESHKSINSNHTYSLSNKHRHMSSHNCFHRKIDHLRVFLNCFYASLISNAFQYAKQVFFQDSHSYSTTHTRIYLLIRSIVSAFCILLYSILIIYSLWSKRIGILSISVFLLIILLIFRFISDLCGYYIDFFEHSIYPPFEPITKDINNEKQKQIIEEITDFSLELIVNSIGILLTMFIVMRMLRKKRQRRQMELDALRIDVLRRSTV